jgi:signal transduction histidine kinase
MKSWLRGKPGGLAAFVMIAGLVAGGLGWATAAAVRLERERLAQRAEAEQADLLRLALWRLDGRVAPLLAREESRPFNHYSAVFAPPLAFTNRGAPWQPGSVLEPSPLLGAELPGWMLLHFQIEPASGWESPQVLSPTLTRRLQGAGGGTSLANVTPQRRQLLAKLAQDLPAAALQARAREHTAPATLRETALLVTNRIMDPANWVNTALQPATPMARQALQQEFLARQGQYSKMQNEAKNPQRYDRNLALTNTYRNGESWFAANTPPAEKPAPAPGSKAVESAEVTVNLTPMVPLWVGAGNGGEQLMLVRLVQIEEKEVCQGILLDAPALQEVLAAEVADLFPGSRLVPVREAVPPRPERTMTALPFQLDTAPAPPARSEPGWTPLRVGLALAWAAALVALLAVGLGGWTLLDLSERRIRFVSAVTHELRTPLTTLRLYLDMLLNGLVRQEGQRDEYLRTLHGEAERLNRLVGNVLDFSRLEKQRPHLVRSRVEVAELLDRLRGTWQGRCQDAGKELVVEDALAPGAALWTDGELVHQVLGNLIDNACKYSRGADDPRLWVRARAEGRRLVFEVEDRGPGVPAGERRAIFRAFRRGRSSDVTAGGVGLGLALARRWTRLLGGRLTLLSTPVGSGASFRVELPCAAEGA